MRSPPRAVPVGCTHFIILRQVCAWRFFTPFFASSMPAKAGKSFACARYTRNVLRNIRFEMKNGAKENVTRPVTPCAWTCDFAGCNYATPKSNIITWRGEIISRWHARPSLYFSPRTAHRAPDRESAQNLDRAIAFAHVAGITIIMLSLRYKSIKVDNANAIPVIPYERKKTWCVAIFFSHAEQNNHYSPAEHLDSIFLRGILNYLRY